MNNIPEQLKERAEFLDLAAKRTKYKVIKPLPDSGQSNAILVGECYYSETLYDAGYNMKQLVADGFLVVFQEPFPFQSELVGKNAHSVISVCPECGSHGVNMPLELTCGNCGYPRTITYYDAETIHGYLARQGEEREVASKAIMWAIHFLSDESKSAADFEAAKAAYLANLPSPPQDTNNQNKEV